MATAAQGTVYCQRCGAPMAPDDRFCRKCGGDSAAPGAATGVATAGISEKRRAVAAILCFLFGVFGVHRFYVGKVGTGLLWLFTLSFLGVGMVVDFILILAGEFRDSDGRKLVAW